ncbi:MAG: hypothetical protein P4L66_16030 [Acetobacteraceae bacterium]|nr:hypothetical protein [Acetobacteraceae bacterium]
MSIGILLSRLTTLEAEGRFGGRAYPEGLEPFPRTLTGQGFFPGGDGLWRDDNQLALRQPSPFAFPSGEIMFLGNDFGSLAGFQRLRLHENPPTWRWLRQRLKHAEIPGHLGFYTNAYLGLRSDRSALAHPMNNPSYNSLCAEYLAFQIRTLLPRLIVVLGSRPAGLLGDLLRLPKLHVGQEEQVSFEEKPLCILPTSHPYSDLGKLPDQRLAEGALLQKAWGIASHLAS